MNYVYCCCCRKEVFDIINVEFPHVYIRHDLEFLFDMLWKVGDERCFKKGNTPVIMDEITLKLHNQVFGIIINGQEMGTTCHLFCFRLFINVVRIVHSNIWHIMFGYMEIAKLKMDDGEFDFGLFLEDTYKVDIIWLFRLMRMNDWVVT